MVGASSGNTYFARYTKYLQFIMFASWMFSFVFLIVTIVAYSTVFRSFSN